MAKLTSSPAQSRAARGMKRVDEDMNFSSGCRWVPGQAWPQGSKAAASQIRHPLKRMKKTFPASLIRKVRRLIAPLKIWPTWPARIWRCAAPSERQHLRVQPTIERSTWQCRATADH